ncbi:translesion error-prone DNA polymerase V autoproteolytic subunit [Arsukibacterium sp.]|uniref:translesion error-prone DNA polymerase V autoproteolytic subunit n=1 Tax=Arsukibacterium sp. TaxID=1977258 RepID=UPI001BD5831D|nr:translesion error-prone DNA polymerase V autoproteolytic subunit [Arsukibacterium sp.]
MTALFPGDAQQSARLAIPLFASKIKAGFPSPAQDYVERTLDLNELCIRHPNATFFVRVEGDSMIEAGIYDNDVLVVDRSIEAEHGDIVVAAVNGEFTVKELCTRPSLMLLPRNAAYQPIRPGNDEELNVFGVVTNVIRQMKRK